MRVLMPGRRSVTAPLYFLSLFACLLFGTLVWSVRAAFLPPAAVTYPKPVETPLVEKSLLNEVGRFWHNVDTTDATRWQDMIHAAGDLAHATPAVRQHTAWLHIWLGEYELAKAENPTTALWHFRRAQHIAPPDSNVVGTATYNTALTHYFQGLYTQSSAEFYRLLLPTTKMRGYPRRSAALWQRHAGAAAGYHARHAQAGIPQPASLDPECGIAGLTVCLQARGLPHDKARILRACRITGLGNNLQDLLAGCAKLGVTGRVVKANSKQLQRLPMPVIAHVEHDHFIVVTGADSKGVRYMCSDCGPWPGGSVNLTWKQWEQMESSLFLTVVRPGSSEDRKLAAVLSDMSDTPRPYVGVQVASASPQIVGQVLQSLQATQNATRQVSYALLQAGCGKRPDSLQDLTPHPMDGDPVDLSTMEEVQSPNPDLVVYNPNGPTVVWQRYYRSLRSNGGNDDNTNDFNPCWSRSYNVLVYDPGVKAYPAFGSGTETDVFANTTSESPTTGTTWEILKAGVVIASSTTPNGWSATSLTLTYIHLTIPSGTTAGSDYKVRWAASTIPTALFTVLAPNTVPQGQYGIFAGSGTDAPANSQKWDIIQNGVILSTEQAPNNWKLDRPTSGGFQITAPVFATPGSGYEVRYSYPVNGVLVYQSAFFSVVAGNIQSTPGNKYLVMPDYSRIEFNMTSVPSASSTVVAGAPTVSGHSFLLKWCYDPNNSLGYYVVNFSDGSTWTLSAQSTPTLPVQSSGPSTFSVAMLQRITDQTNHSILLQYTTSVSANSPWIPLLSNIKDETSNQTLLTINHNAGYGKVDSVTDVYGRSVYYSFLSDTSPLSQVSQVVTTGTASPPLRWKYTYGTVSPDSAVYMLTISAPSPTGTGLSTTTVGYAGTGFVNSVTDANGNRHEFTHLAPYWVQVEVSRSSTQSVVEQVPHDGNTVATSKDPIGNVIAQRTVWMSMGLAQTQAAVGDTSGTVVGRVGYLDLNCPNKPSKIIDAEGRTGYFTYDVYGNVLTSTNARGNVTTYTYDFTSSALGRLTQVQTDTRPATTFEYFEPSGLVKKITGPSPTGSGTVSTSFTYDALGNVLTITAPGNITVSTIVTTFNYTTDGTYTKTAAKGQPVTITDNLGHVTHLRYDAQGNVVSAWDALGNTVDTTYNIANQVTAVQYPATGQTGVGRSRSESLYQYPGGMLATSRLFNEGNVKVREVNYAYGLEGETLGVTGNTRPTTTTYDALYRVKTITDGNNNTTSYSYDAAGNLSQVTLPGGDTVSYPSYTASGRLLQRVDGRGIVTNYIYNDPAGALTDVQYPANTARNVHYTYDTYGRLSGLTDSTGSRGWLYNDLDQPNHVWTTYTGLAAKHIYYQYYANGTRRNMITSAGTFTTTFDGAGRLKQLVNPFNDTTTWTYLNNNWVSTQTLANGVTTTYTKNPLGQVNRLLSTKGATTLSDYSGMTYDAVGNRQGMNVSLPAATALSGSVTYQYSGKDEVTQEASTQAGGWTGNFGYDNAGNLTNFKGLTRAFNAKNQLTGGTNLGSFSYDNNGNPTTYNGTTCTYDEENHLKSAGSLLTANYRSDGLRAWKQNSSGTRTYFVYDGTTPLLELDASGNVKAVNTFGANGLVSRWTVSTPGGTTGTSVYYGFDARGNTTQRYDALGNVLSSHIYDAYGMVQSSGSSTAGDPFGFGAQDGYYTDQETNLVLCTFRYYDPANGRWLNRDPIGYAGGLNLYTYCSGNPINFTDPLGWCNAGEAGMSPQNAWNYLADYANKKFSDGLDWVRNHPRTVSDAVFLMTLGDVQMSAPSPTESDPGLLSDMDKIAMRHAGVQITTGGASIAASAAGSVAGDGRAISNVPDRGTFAPDPSITTPYSRPTGAGPTPAQRNAVQGRPCVECGRVTNNQVPDHIDPLAVEYYRTGTNDIAHQSSTSAVQPHCPTCSSIQGGQLAAFSRWVKGTLGI